jgi:hypothetical protein
MTDKAEAQQVWKNPKSFFPYPRIKDMIHGFFFFYLSFSRRANSTDFFFKAITRDSNMV